MVIGAYSGRWHRANGYSRFYARVSLCFYFVVAMLFSVAGWLRSEECKTEGPALSATPVFTGGHVGILNQAKMSCYNFYAVYFRRSSYPAGSAVYVTVWSCCAVKDAVGCECLLNHVMFLL